jgi:hypothetical protein
MKTLGFAVLLCAAAFAEPRITYIKQFPGSSPAYIGITVERSGKTVYTEAPKDDFPLEFKLQSAEADEIFGLADKLDKFSRPLESGLKVANMGMKTFRFEDGAVKHEVKFNFSMDENAKALHDWFEKISESEQNYIRLEKTVKYDKLGVNQALLIFQSSWDRKRVVAPEQYLPLLDRVAKNDSYMNIARDRAAILADAIRGLQKQAKSE